MIRNQRLNGIASDSVFFAFLFALFFLSSCSNETPLYEIPDSIRGTWGNTDIGAYEYLRISRKQIILVHDSGKDICRATKITIEKDTLKVYCDALLAKRRVESWNRLLNMNVLLDELSWVVEVKMSIHATNVYGLNVRELLHPFNDYQVVGFSWAR